MLPERAPSEGPRSTAAIGATWVPCRDETVQKEGGGYPLCSRTLGKRQAVLLVPERENEEAFGGQQHIDMDRPTMKT